MLLVLPLLLGCAQVPPEVNRFSPLENKLENADVTGRAILYEYNSVLVLYVELSNKTARDITAKEYTIELSDGRDLKPVKMLKRSDLEEVKAKYSGGGAQGAIQDQLIAASMNNIMNAVNVPTRDKLISIIERGIDEYFEFRPLYAGEQRKGVLCFLPEFKLEYPLTLTIKERGKTLAVQFQPKLK